MADPDELEAAALARLSRPRDAALEAAVMYLRLGRPVRLTEPDRPAHPRDGRPATAMGAFIDDLSDEERRILRRAIDDELARRAAAASDPDTMARS